MEHFTTLINKISCRPHTRMDFW